MPRSVAPMLRRLAPQAVRLLATVFYVHLMSGKMARGVGFEPTRPFGHEISKFSTDTVPNHAHSGPDASTHVRIPPHASSDFEDFKKYLILKKRRNVSQIIICYVTKYGYILRTGNA
jgi:hypothetical protein